MSGVELGLAVIGTVDLCLRYGKQLLEKYDSFKSAEQEITERTVSLAGQWKRISLQLQFLKQIWSSFDEEHQDLQDQILQILLRKLDLAVSQISKVQTKHDQASPRGLSRLKRWKYAFVVKECLDSTIQELEAWKTIFDPSWYLIIRVASPLIDVELAKKPSQTTALSVANRLRQALTTEPLVRDRQATRDLGWSALVGFRSVRMADGKTLRHGDAAWDRNLYRQPDRQGLFPEADYTMQHDIYSLGVCMLEIGLWKSFVAYDQSGAPSLGQTKADFPDITNPNTKDIFVKLATEVLPQRMGNKYAEVVVNCLTCMDQGNPDFGNGADFQDEDGVLIGVKYIEKILLQLDAISI